MYRYCHFFYYNAEEKETLFFFKGKCVGKMMNKPSRLLEEWCLNHGATLDGRLKSARYLTKIVQKPPILVSEKDAILFLPTASYSSEDCFFIQYKYLLKISSNDEKLTMLQMTDGTIYHLSIDARIIKKQRKRAEVFLKKMKLINRKFILLEIE